MLIRSNTEGESWVDDVQEGMKNMMSAEAAAAAPNVSAVAAELERMYELIDDLDRLVGSVPGFLLGRWLAAAAGSLAGSLPPFSPLPTSSPLARRRGKEVGAGGQCPRSP